MRFKQNVMAGLSVMILGAVLTVAGQEQAKKLDTSVSTGGPDSAAGSAPVHAKAAQDAADAHFEGEKRFRANCGRCHMAPHKFPPRMMVTIERHMRVRAMITDEDMRFIVGYMTE